MSAFGKVSLSNNEVNAVESVVEDVVTTSAVEEQVEKFDTSYSADKLQELYAEYDKITIDEEKVKSLTQVKTNAVSTAVPFRLVLGITTTAIVSVLLLFLCVYNIFVINGMNNSISYLQEEVMTCSQELVQVEGVYNQLTDPTNIQKELTAINDGLILNGNFPTNGKKLVKQFVKYYKLELLEMWNTGNYKKLPPLN